jgi:hypothetical protein
MRTYRARQARFVAACREHVPGARALGIEAGLHVVLAFEPGLDDRAAAARLAERGLACVPLSAFYADSPRSGPSRSAPPSSSPPRSAPPSSSPPRSAPPRSAGPARIPGLVCGYSRLPETSAAAAAALIGQVTSDLLPLTPASPHQSR